MNSENSYKKSDLGMFPINWELKSFDELFDIKGGFSASRADLSEKGYCYLHYGDIHGSDKTFIDTEEDFLKIPKLDVPLNKISNGSLLNDGDVVFVDAEPARKRRARRGVWGGDEEEEEEGEGRCCCWWK